MDGGWEEFEEDVFAREFAAGVKAQRGCLASKFAWKYRVVDVDADAGDSLGVD